MSTIALNVEGVLRRSNGGQPLREGVELYYGLATRAKLVLLTSDLKDIKANPADPLSVRGTELAWWLHVEGLSEHALIVYNDPVWITWPIEQQRVAQVNYARQLGHDVTMVVEPDPAVAAELIDNGYHTLLFTHASYSVPSWRPDHKSEPTPWNTLAETVAHNAFLRANDKRDQ